MMAEMAEIPPPPQRKVLLTQRSTVWTRRQQAVCVRRAVKSYGTKKCPTTVLSNLNMTVPRGKIYGLLGASGCGKTTLLSCIVGRRRLNSGEIWVLGGKPGSKGSGVPGPRIGYMPQEIALYGEFTIRETFIYFAWISGMTTEEAEERLDFYLKLLMLPTQHRLVKNLSGGQQRRVSLGAALLHDPELLILDEPTVGVDPLLRQSIWDHLIQISKDDQKTVIITTHYIDETRQAGMIGLMRGGKFLAEDTPDNLLRQFNAESLEDVFLKLSLMQNKTKRRRSSFMIDLIGASDGPNTADPSGDEASEISGEFGDAVKDDRSSVIGAANVEPSQLPPDDEIEGSFCDNFKVLSWHHMKALLWKNFLWMWRNGGMIAFIIGLPVLEVILFCLSIGHDPVGLRFAIVNHEVNTSLNDCPFDAKVCGKEQLSCRYLKFLKDRKIELDYFDDINTAIERVRLGHAWAALEFSGNYSEAVWDRINLGRYADDDSIEFSQMRIWMDQTDQQIGMLLNRSLHLAFLDYAEDLANSCDLSTKAALPPIRFNDPVYGDQIPNFTDFAAPGVILSLIFFLAVALTSGAILIERNEGMLERSLVLGINANEILASHIVTQCAVMICQSIAVLIVAFAIFNVTIRGSIFIVLLLVCVTGFCGMCYGFVVSCSCETERTATYMAIGSFLPIIMLCGIIWPVEGMHFTLKFISSFLPLTLSTESLRSVLQRGWSIDTPTVYNGFLATGAWIAIFLTLSVLSLKFRRG